MVDMSATLIHHGHIRLLNKASDLGEVIVALTSDQEILKAKGYEPELNFSSRKFIISSIKGVTEVIESPWLINEDFLDLHNIDYLVHGSDNVNQISQDRLITFPRTKDISSTILREKAAKIYKGSKS